MRQGLIGKIFGGIVAVGAAGVLGFLGYLAVNTNDIHLRTDKKIEPGYINPERLKIELLDQNRNREQEVILKYGSKSYALMEDKEGNPVIREYELREKPSENIPPVIVIKE
jgi:hypothetical protein